MPSAEVAGALHRKQRRAATGTPYGVAGASAFGRFLKTLPLFGQLVGDDDDDNDTEELDEEEEDEEEEHVDAEEEEAQADDQAGARGDEEDGETAEEQPPQLVAAVAAGVSPERGANAKSPLGSSRRAPSPAAAPATAAVELGPVLRSQRRKNSSAQKAFLPAPAQKSKALRIGGGGGAPDSPDDELRGRANRRRARLAGSPMDSPLAALKHKKPISYEEYERLSHKLRELVETSPQASLALTQNALARGFDERPHAALSLPKNLSYVPGAMTLRTTPSPETHEKRSASDSGSLDLQLAPGVPFGKRARTGENRPIYFSGLALRGQMLTREERVERKPRPSRLLTGAKRDAAARSAYSSAVAEKILSTLNKVQNPLEREAKKPTPQTSLSWAKYHLALTDDSASARPDVDESMDEAAPPVTSLPRVLFSPQAVSLTPAPSTRARMVAADAAQHAYEQLYGSHAFTVPASSVAVLQGKRKVVDDDLDEIRFVFSPSPDQREPPKRVQAQKARKVKGAVETPFSFVPASPKSRSEWTGAKPKSQASQKPQEAAPASAKKPASAKPTEVAVPAASSSGVNPLARFTQMAPGSWKCPTCSVTNQATHSKCPCCETAKPSSVGTTGSAKPATTTAATPAVSSGVNPLARFAQMAPGSWKCPTCSVTNQESQNKCPCCETAKPGGVSAPSSAKPAAPKSAGTIIASGFSFGAPAASTKPAAVTEAPKASFSFGVAPTSTAAESKKESSGDVSVPSFTFSAPPAASAGSGASKPSFSFGVTSDVSSESTSTNAPSFSFSAPAASSMEVKSTVPAFSFGAPSAAVAKPIAKKDEESSSAAAKPVVSAPSFSFGAATSSPSPIVAKAPATSSASSFSFGSSSEEPKASNKRSLESEEPAAKKPSFSFGSSEPSKPEATVPAFSFGAKTGGADSTPASFGFKSTPVKVPELLKESEPKAAAAAPKPAFTFGSSSAAPAPSTFSSIAEKPTAGFGQDSSSKPAFTFGQSSTASPPKPAAPASTTFGSSSPAFGNPSTLPAPAFGSAPAAAASAAAPSFTFGVQSTPAAATSAAKPPTAAPAASTFSFGAQSTPAATTAAKPAAAPQPAFTFGSSMSAAAPAASGFGSASSSPAFGVSTSATPVSAAPSFTFGASSQSAAPAPSSTFTFGATAPSTSTGGFGTSSTPAASGFGSSASSSSGFGSSASGAASGFRTPSPAFGAPAAAPAFGSSTPAPTGFSAPAATGFGAAAPAATTFGSAAPAPSGFGSAAPAPSGFGAAPAASGFGAAPAATGFGASPGFGGAAPASTTFGSSGGFGASAATSFGAPAAPTSGFGSAQQSSAFGGSSGFGASSGFGTPAAPTAFGAAAPAPAAGQGGFGTPSPVFGAPAGASSGGFGGAPSSGFGSGPATSFGGAPGGGFGAPAPAAGGFGGAPSNAFGAPQEGGFSVGAAPQTQPKRRILKARSKRTS